MGEPGIKQAMQSGFKALCITVGTPYRPPVSGPPSPAHLQVMGSPATDWKTIDALRQGSSAPVVLKGIMRPDDAAEAVKRGIHGIVVSDYGGELLGGAASSLEVLPSIADAVGGKIPILIDGSFRRGTDVVKAAGPVTVPPDMQIPLGQLLVGRGAYDFDAAIAGVRHRRLILKLLQRQGCGTNRGG
jgi:hypothetical protein